jgi:hypothetical protein
MDGWDDRTMLAVGGDASAHGARDRGVVGHDNTDVLRASWMMPPIVFGSARKAS